MKIGFIVVVLYVISSLAACSSETNCFVADSVSLVKTIKIGKLDHHVYLRVSGFQEKEVFYELYTDKPKFDACGKSATRAKSDVHVDTTRGAASKLVVENQQLTIVYAGGEAPKIEYKDLPIVLNEPPKSSIQRR